MVLKLVFYSYFKPNAYTEKLGRCFLYLGAHTNLESSRRSVLKYIGFRMSGWLNRTDPPIAELNIFERKQFGERKEGFDKSELLFLVSKSQD